LIVQNKASSGYNALLPFMVSVPNEIENEYIYNVNGTPKLEVTKTSGGKNLSTPTPNPGTSSTPTPTPKPGTSSSPTPTVAPRDPAIITTPIPTKTPGTTPTDSEGNPIVEPSEEGGTENPVSGEVITSEPTPYSNEEQAEGKTPTAKQSAEKLPQTGQLNWPIPVLAAIGLTAFAAGWMLLCQERKARKKK
jgi:hypothetical protein